MIREGWRCGATFDPAEKVHDALVPFPELTRYDRCALRTAIEAEDVEARLGALVDYPRGDDRPFGAEEMRAGLEVGLAADLDGAGSERGRVVEWALTPEGCLDEITVRWEDGTVSRHCPSERDLRRPRSPGRA